MCLPIKVILVGFNYFLRLQCSTLWWICITFSWLHFILKQVFIICCQLWRIVMDWKNCWGREGVGDVEGKVTQFRNDEKGEGITEILISFVWKVCMRVRVCACGGVGGYSIFAVIADERGGRVPLSFHVWKLREEGSCSCSNSHFHFTSPPPRPLTIFGQSLTSAALY